MQVKSFTPKVIITKIRQLILLFGRRGKTRFDLVIPPSSNQSPGPPFSRSGIYTTNVSRPIPIH